MFVLQSFVKKMIVSERHHLHRMNSKVFDRQVRRMREYFKFMSNG